METRVANISIIVEKFDKIEELNSLLHEYSDRQNGSTLPKEKHFGYKHCG